VVGSGVNQQRRNHFRVAFVVDPDRDLDPPPVALQVPVEDIRRKEGGVWYHQLGSPPGSNQRGPHADILDHAARGADLNGVANPDRPFEEQDQTGHKIVDDVLQAETDADTQAAGHESSLAEVETDG